MNSVKQYLKFVRPYIWQIIGTILIGILKFGIPLLIPLILRYVIDNIIGGDMSDSQKLSDLFWLLEIQFEIFLLLRQLMEFERQYLVQWPGSKILYEILEFQFNHLQRLDLN